ncbi:MAG: hypothetical protein II859_07425 [Bacteroidales bacterium]|nr:hypothetical protein [Bacteroidales bacterium]
MRKMRYIQTIVVSALLLVVWLPSQAQFAGEDKTVLKVPNNSQEVTIGEAPEKDGYCYQWTGPNIVGDSTTAKIKVNPRFPKEDYFVKRISDCDGVEYDKVTVKLVDTISIVSVKPTRCYNDGDTIKREHFEIVTLPEGYESMVTVSPIIAHHPTTEQNPEWIQSVNFRLEYNNHTSHKSAKVSVINDSKPLNISFNPDFLEFEKDIKEAEEVLDLALKIKEGILLPLSKGFPIEIGCDPSFNISAAIPTFSCYCCEGKRVNTFNLPGWGFSGSIGCEAAIPIPALSCPIPCAKTGLFLTIGFSGGLSLGPTYIVWRGKCSYVEIPGELTVEIHGGARVQALDKDFLSLTAQLGGVASREFSWKLGKPFDIGHAKLQCTLSGEIVATSLIKVPFNVVLGEVVLE